MEHSDYPMTTEEQTRLSLARVGRDFMYGKITEAEWLAAREALHARLDELVYGKVETKK